MTNQIEKQGVQILDISKPLSQKDVAEAIKSRVLSGQIDAAKTGVVLKRWEKVIETLKADKEFRQYVSDETEKYLENGKTGELFGCKVQKTALYTAYDFKVCGHSEYDAIIAIEEELKERKKVIEEELKLILKTKESKDNKKQMSFGIQSDSKDIFVERVPKLVWEETGTLDTCDPPVKYQTIGIKYLKV